MLAGLALTTQAAEPVIASRASGRLEGARQLISRKASRVQVAAQLGLPDTMLSHEIWIYHGFELNHSQDAKDPGALFVVFERDQVVGMKFTTSAFMHDLLAEIARRSPAQSLRDPVYVVKER